MSHLMLNLNATVTVCHSKTNDLEKFTKEADILICAIGKKGFNVKLASRVTHYKIDVKTKEEAIEMGINFV